MKSLTLILMFILLPFLILGILLFIDNAMYPEWTHLVAEGWLIFYSQILVGSVLVLVILTELGFTVYALFKSWLYVLMIPLQVVVIGAAIFVWVFFNQSAQLKETLQFKGKDYYLFQIEGYTRRIDFYECAKGACRGKAIENLPVIKNVSLRAEKNRLGISIVFWDTWSECSISIDPKKLPEWEVSFYGPVHQVGVCE